MQTKNETEPKHRHEAAPVVTVRFRAPSTWSVQWDEPRLPGQCESYAPTARADMLPVVGAYFDAWKAARPPAASNNAFFHESAYGGSVRRIDEAAARDLVEIIRAVFPHAVVTWPKARASRQRCDRCKYMSPDRTCAVPDAAGLAALRLPVWCDLMGGHGRTCPAFRSSTGT